MDKTTQMPPIGGRRRPAVEWPSRGRLRPAPTLTIRSSPTLSSTETPNVSVVIIVFFSYSVQPLHQYALCVSPNYRWRHLARDGQFVRLQHQLQSGGSPTVHFLPGQSRGTYSLFTSNLFKNEKAIHLVLLSRRRRAPEGVRHPILSVKYKIRITTGH
jgi:hypothetical protein